MPTKTADDLRRAVENISRAVGTPPETATVLADILVGSHLAGHDSHGIQHLPRYIKEVQAGEIVPGANPEIIEQTASAALVTGNWGWGHLTADFVTRIGIKKARENRVDLTPPRTFVCAESFSYPCPCLCPRPRSSPPSGIDGAFGPVNCCSASRACLQVCKRHPTPSTGDPAATLIGIDLFLQSG